MADEDKAQRTEPATPKKRQEAREKGQVAQSRELQSVAVLAAAVIALSSPLGVHLVRRVIETLRVGLASGAHPPATLGDFEAMLVGFVAPVALATFPIMLLLALLGGAAQVAQTGPLFSPQVLQPRGDRISLVAGTKRMFSLDRVFELAKALLKVSVVGAVGWLIVQADFDRLIGLTGLGVVETAAQTGTTARKLAFAILALLGLMAAIDVLYQRWRYEEQLKMSRSDVRDEMRQAEGDPHMKGRFKNKHRELSRARMIAAVAEADVVVTNPTHFAVALKYDRDTMAAPKVVAKGQDHVAARIRAAAEEHRIPIVENPPVARLLHKACEVGQEVPPKLFQAVAEVLAYVYRLDRRKARAWSASP